MERQNREAQEKAQEERRRQIDNERRQARLRLERVLNHKDFFNRIL